MLHLVENTVRTWQASVWVAALIAALAIFSLFLLAYSIWYAVPGSQGALLAERLDLAIAYIFLTDFFAGLFFNSRREGKRAYLRQNWLNLISSIPVSGEFVRFLRILRALRAFRIIRATLNLRFAVGRYRRNLPRARY